MKEPADGIINRDLSGSKLKAQNSKLICSPLATCNLPLATCDCFSLLTAPARLCYYKQWIYINLYKEGMRVDFKESGFMYGLAAFVILFVVAQSVFFMVRAWKRGRQLGIPDETMKNTVFSSVLFTIAPAISILTTVIALAGALGIVLPWIRLSVIGNLAYETTASETMLTVLGSSLSTEVTDPAQFGAVAWVMTIGTSFTLVLLPLMCKTIQKKIGAAVHKSESSSRTADIVSAAAFIGIIAAFIARAIYGKTPDGVGDAGFMSICTLVTAVIVSLILETLCDKFKLTHLQPFAMPLSMFAAMGMAVVLNLVVPEQVAAFTWWG